MTDTTQNRQLLHYIASEIIAVTNG